MTDPRRVLPAVGPLLDAVELRPLVARTSRAFVSDVIRGLIDEARQSPDLASASREAWLTRIAAEAERRARPSLRAVLNATGVVLHTNLGRAPLAPAALDAVADVARGFVTLEYDLDAGARGSRHTHGTALLAELTGAEDALVVNNGAAALVLALNTVALGRDAIISRGELVEIGGSFRVPDIMARSGARLVEVGTTNRTHAGDYRQALSPSTGAVMSVHRSNFAQAGFVASVGVRDLAPIAAEGNVPLIHDLGSGLLLDLSAWGLTGEPTARDAVAAGASLVLFSGDKLLGGPQAGIIVGRRDLIAAMRRNPLARAFRGDKLTLAALNATLALYRDPARAMAEIPALAMLTAPVAALDARADRIVAALAVAGITARASRASATVGGGAFPTAQIPSAAVVLDGDASGRDARLRAAAVPVVARVADGAVWCDLRAIPARDDAALIASLIEAAA